MKAQFRCDLGIKTHFSHVGERIWAEQTRLARIHKMNINIDKGSKQIQEELELGEYYQKNA